MERTLYAAEHECRHGQNADEHARLSAVRRVKFRQSPYADRREEKGSRRAAAESASPRRSVQGGRQKRPALQPKSGTVGSVLPASGNRNGDNLNNRGSNGNYWSSTLNSNDVSNAYNLNFNSGNHNVNNNNNRYYGFPVRPVAALTFPRGMGNNGDTRLAA